MNNSTNETNTSAEVEVINPTKSRDAYGLTVKEQTEATALQKQLPEVVSAVRQVSEYEAGLADRYFKLCVALRSARLPVQAGGERTLSRKEVTILLRSLGYAKQRITEINRVIEVSDEIWAKYEERHLTFKATLSLARGGKDANGQQHIPETHDTATPPAPLPVERPKMPSSVQSAIAETLKKWKKPKETKGDLSYDLVTIVGGYKFDIRIFVDKTDAAQGPAE